MGAEGKRMQMVWVFLPLLFSLSVLTGCSGTLMPYESSFQCPGGYNGICESIDDAYQDSVSGIDPRQFDEKWKEKKEAWEESHSELIEARNRMTKGMHDTDQHINSASYRQSYLRKLQDLMEAPETPVLVPPKVIRILVLPRTFEEKRSLVGSHYLFSQLEDRPRWILTKVPEIPEPCEREEKEGLKKTEKVLRDKSSPADGKKQQETEAGTGIETRKASQGCQAPFASDEEDEELEWVP